MAISAFYFAGWCGALPVLGGIEHMEPRESRTSVTSCGSIQERVVVVGRSVECLLIVGCWFSNWFVECCLSLVITRLCLTTGWCEGWLMLRRFSIVLTYTLPISVVKRQALLSSLCVGFAMLHIQCQPFQSQRVNLCETAMLCCLVLISILGMLQNQVGKE